MATKIPSEIPDDLTELRPWTLLTSHAHVLLAIAQEPTRIVPEIAAAAQISERSAYRILSDLQRAGYLRKRKLGRRNGYEIAVDAPLLDPLVGHSPIGGLLALALRERAERTVREPVPPILPAVTTAPLRAGSTFGAVTEVSL